MEEDFKKSRGDHACPQLLDLISNEREWIPRDAGGGVRDGEGLKASEDKDLELRLGLPGRGGTGRGGEEDSSVLSLGLYSKSSSTTTTTTTTLSAGVKRGFFDTIQPKSEELQQKHAGFVPMQSGTCLGKELSKKNSGTAGIAEQQQSFERKASHVAAAGANSSSQPQTRNVSAPVVGWPPIRSFRKNLASSSYKPLVESPAGRLDIEKPENLKKGLFVKINMDGFPIGRKVDLNAYDNYEKLSEAVEELFQGLLAAQKDPSSADAETNKDKQLFTGLLDGTGEYTLVYEDAEGDRMLVGDVPWDMFVCTAKRLRALKSSDLSTMRLGAVSRKRAATEC